MRQMSFIINSIQLPLAVKDVNIGFMHYSEIDAYIYDVDDTLLDNRPQDGGYNLHEQSRLIAIHHVGREMGHAALIEVTAEENEQAFLTAATHTMDHAIWTILQNKGIVSG